MHSQAMRRFLPVTATLFLAACATRPQPPVAEPTPAPSPERRSNLVGLTARELVGHFGSPALQVREGASLKLQFRGRYCVLDAYLYPSGSGSGELRVTHVDTRAPSGVDTDQAACISALETAS
jgi:outer membrane biogenesis lipoprotein LolB